MPMRDVGLRSADRDLQASIYAPDAPDSTGILFLQGYESLRATYDDYARAVSGQGATAVTVDLGGYGDSDGSLRRLLPVDHLDDARAAYDMLAAQDGVDPDRIGVMGASYGGYLALLLCRTRTPESLLLRAPAIQEALPHDGDIEAAKAALPERSVLRVVGDFTGPITVVESEQDRTVPREGILACIKMARDVDHRVIEGAKHVLEGEEREVFTDMLLGWAEEL